MSIRHTALCTLMLFGCIAGVEVAAPAEADEALSYDSLGTQLGPITASIAKLNAATDEALGLVARIEAQHNEVIEFYEPTEGQLVISGAGAPVGGMIAQDLQWDSDHYLDSWAVIAGDAKMPAGLFDTLGRSWMYEFEKPLHALADREREEAGQQRTQHAPKAGDSSADLLREEEGVALSTHALGGPLTNIPGDYESGWCLDEWRGHYVQTYEGRLGDCQKHTWNASTGKGGWSYCRDYIGGGAYAWSDAVSRVKMSVCPYRGTVTMSVDASYYTVGGSWNVTKNTGRWYIESANNVFGCEWQNDCPRILGRVDNAYGGDRYHMRFNVLTFRY